MRTPRQNPTQPQTGRGIGSYTLFAVAFLSIAAVGFVACNSTQIRDESQLATKELTSTQEALAQRVTGVIRRLVSIRDNVVAGLRDVADISTEERVQFALRDMAEAIDEEFEEVLQELVEAMNDHQQVLRVVVGRLNQIYSWALDDASLLSLLEAPLRILGIPSLPTGQQGGNRARGGGMTTGGTVAAVGTTLFTAFALYEGTKRGGGALIDKMRRGRQKREHQFEQRMTNAARKAHDEKHQSNRMPRASGEFDTP